MYSYLQSIPALVASLINDPFYQAITVDFGADDARRRHALERYFEYSLGEAERTGRCVMLEDSRLGAAAWLLPRSPSVEVSEAAAKAKYVADILGPEGYENYRCIIHFMSPRAEQIVPSHAWYLSIVGVLPSQQGSGQGAKLLGSTLAEATREQCPCYLETYTPRNLTFYRRAGFKSIASHLEPITNSEYVVMLRDA